MRASARLAFVLVLLTTSAAFFPSIALAQASLTGIVRDTSGAVLPGVTVEAASPVLIEKVRSAVTGGVEETVTVTGESPTIDVQTTTRQQVISRDVLNTLPTGRNYNTLGQLLTAVTPSRIDSGGALGDPMVSLSVHGSRDGDQRVMQNGVGTMTLQG